MVDYSRSRSSHRSRSASRSRRKKFSVTTSSSSRSRSPARRNRKRKYHDLDEDVYKTSTGLLLHITRINKRKGGEKSPRSRNRYATVEHEPKQEYKLYIENITPQPRRKNCMTFCQIMRSINSKSI